MTKPKRPPRLSLAKKAAALPNKILQTYSIETKNDYAYGMPDQIQVEPSSICNLRCPTCICTVNDGVRPKAIMPLDKFKRIVDEVKPYVTKMPLFNYGEPFLNPNMLDMIEYASKAGIYVSTNTNGQFTLTEENYRRLVGSGLKYLIYSLDGLEQSSVSEFREGIKVNECIENLKSILKAKKEANSEYPYIELQFIIMKHNVNIREEVKAFGEEIGVDRVVFKTMWVSPLMEGYEELYKRFVPEDEKLTRYKKKEDTESTIKPDVERLCKLPWKSALINADGSVVACCYDLKNEEIFGNVFEQSFRDIWNGEKYRSFRKRLMEDRSSIEICRSCSLNKTFCD